MKNITKIVLILALTTFFLPTLEAQKFGYMNSTELLNELPEIKAANSELEALQKQLSAKMQKKIENLQARYEELGRKENQGEISPRELQDEANILRQEETGLQQEEQNMQNQLLQKREELYSPIIDRVESAIKAVANENGFTYIFDSSGGFLLFAEESLDVSDLVRAKLNG